MSDPELRARLSDADVPDAAAARDRAWAAVEAAYAARRPARRRVLPARPAVALAVALTSALAVTVAAASTPPGAAVRGLVVRVLGGEPPPAPRARLGPLPAGRMLVTSPRGAWVVERDGSRRLLGPYAGATWSPRGLYAAVWARDELRAVAPDGRVAWGLRVPGRVSDARWSPDGFRIAYRRGDGLGVVAGDGTGGRPLAARVLPAAPAWRPGAPHTLAWVGADGRVVVRDVDGGDLVWRSPAPVVSSARELSWSADGDLLLVRGAGELQLADVATGRVEPVRLPAGERPVGAAWAPRGRRLAVVARQPERDVSRLLVAPAAPRIRDRPVFATKGRLGAPVWSPDGARVLVRGSEADEWLLLPASPRAGRARGPRVVAIAPVARRFGGAPAVRGWCCS
jgi:dipeptidyl aminopeptidase/acylaminoacyl peptidase